MGIDRSLAKQKLVWPRNKGLAKSRKVLLTDRNLVKKKMNFAKR